MIGIDLGTSNSSVCFWNDEGNLQHLAIAQCVDHNRVGRSPLLPSAIFLSRGVEGIFGDDVGFWPHKDDWRLGSYVLKKGIDDPGRLIRSAKSWLCHKDVDRKKAILPQHSDVPELKLSPLEASARVIEYLILALKSEKQKVSDRDIVVAVPASFDPVARQLTESAAKLAGINSVVLLEEPIAALYAWLYEKGEKWREELAPGDVILICDVGGGTCDFSLVAAKEEDGFLKLDRVSVGDHLLLGGDNIDLAIAHLLQEKLEEQGHQIDDLAMEQLILGSKDAKENLLGDHDNDVFHLSISQSGGDLFAGTLSVSLTRSELEELLLSGFLPLLNLEEKNLMASDFGGIRELGLHFEREPAISKHLLQFLRRSFDITSERGEETSFQSRGGAIQPTKILFNGGAFKSSLLRKRILEILKTWFDKEVHPLQEMNLELSVSLGAAYYGKIRKEDGIRVRAGTSHSYYIGIESNTMAIPGRKRKVNGICLVPQKTEEGSQIALEGREFGLVTGQPSTFQFYTSADRSKDHVGVLVKDAEQNLKPSGLLQVTIPKIKGESQVVPVALNAHLTEVGVLKLFMSHTKSDKTWELEFDVRGNRDQ